MAQVGSWSLHEMQDAVLFRNVAKGVPSTFDSNGEYYHAFEVRELHFTFLIFCMVCACAYV
jgi:hypothetical protein